METTHTPGPWEVQELNHVNDYLWLQVGYKGRGPICRINTAGERMADDVVAEIKLMATPEENQRANAKIIAAAPDMLEALKLIVKGEAPYSMDHLKFANNTIKCMQEWATAAIDKATKQD